MELASWLNPITNIEFCKSCSHHPTHKFHTNCLEIWWGLNPIYKRCPNAPGNTVTWSKCENTID